MMKNKNYNGSAAGTAIALFLSVFLIAILLVAMLGIMKVTDYDAGVAAVIFAVINMVLIAFVYGLGGAISKKIGVGGYAPVAGMTAVYTLAQFLYMFMSYKKAEPLSYTLISMVILFIYCLISLPIALNGSKNKNN